MIVPFWPTQLHLIVDVPRTLPQQLTMLKMPGQEHEFHPLIKKKFLVVYRLSGNPLKCSKFFKRAEDIILQFWRYGTLKQYSSYIMKWITFCSNQQFDCVSSTLSQALAFLVELFRNGIGYSGINTARSSLSCNINLLALILQLQGSSKGFLDQNPQHHDTHEYGKLARYFATLRQCITQRIYH